MSPSLTLAQGRLYLITTTKFTIFILQFLELLTKVRYQRILLADPAISNKPDSNRSTITQRSGIAPNYHRLLSLLFSWGERCQHKCTTEAEPPTFWRVDEGNVVLWVGIDGREIDGD